MREMKVPFDPAGNLLHYAKLREYYQKDVVWLDNLEFETKMTLMSFERGRSAAYFIMQNPSGRRHPMFMKDLFEMLMATTSVNGEVYGTWTFVKRGQNYGLQWVR